MWGSDYFDEGYEYQDIAEEILDDTVRIMQSNTGETKLSKKYALKLQKAEFEKKIIEAQFEGACKMGCMHINSLVKERGKEILQVDIDLLEPRYSYYWRYYTDLINNPKQKKSLNDLMSQPIIDPKEVYQCKLTIENNEVFLTWNNGKHWLYDFGNKSNSARRNLFEAAITNPDILLSKKDLEEKTGEKYIGARLKEHFTKMFLRKTLNELFVISDYSPKEGHRIGVKSLVSVSGYDLIKIIREQLAYSTNEKRQNMIDRNRKFMQKMSKTCQ